VRRVLLVQGSTRPLPSPCPCPVPPRHGRMGYLAPAGGELASAVHGRRAAAHAHLDSGGQRRGHAVVAPAGWVRSGVSIDRRRLATEAGNGIDDESLKRLRAAPCRLSLTRLRHGVNTDVLYT
jgi:hypothetical protein